MFAKLFQEFMRARAEYYEEMKDKVGGLKIHVPIPIIDDSGKYALAALLHGLWAIYLGRPEEVLRVSEEGAEYVEIEEAEVPASWRGPIHDQRFWENEERLLEISAAVFDLYLSNSRGDLVEEYAERFLAITPPEFMVYYNRLNPHFLSWLMQRPD